MMKVLLDTNIVIDWLTDRMPFADASSDAIEFSVDNGLVYVSATAITDIFYIVRKTDSIEAAKTAITKILEILKIAAVDEADIRAAKDSLFTDFEDAVQFVCAKKLRVDYIITRDPEGFEISTIPALSPEEFLKLQNA
jgi:predicted nucleic acid-binding protein